MPCSFANCTTEILPYSPDCNLLYSLINSFGTVGICLYQRAVVTAHKHNKPLKIGDSLYYVQDGRERLQEVLEKICK